MLVNQCNQWFCTDTWCIFMYIYIYYTVLTNTIFLACHSCRSGSYSRCLWWKVLALWGFEVELVCNKQISRVFRFQMCFKFQDHTSGSPTVSAELRFCFGWWSYMISCWWFLLSYPGMDCQGWFILLPNNILVCVGISKGEQKQTTSQSILTCLCWFEPFFSAQFERHAHCT